MKILIEGTEKEIILAKSTLKGVCLFHSEFCTVDKRCEECEKEQNLKIDYVVKNLKCESR